MNRHAFNADDEGICKHARCNRNRWVERICERIESMKSMMRAKRPTLHIAIIKLINATKNKSA